MLCFNVYRNIYIYTCMLIYTYAYHDYVHTCMIIHIYIYISNAGSASKNTLQFAWDKIHWDEIHSPNLSMLGCYYLTLPQ